MFFQNENYNIRGILGRATVCLTTSFIWGWSSDFTSLHSYRCHSMSTTYALAQVPYKIILSYHSYRGNGNIDNRGADRRRVPCRQAQLACAVPGVRSSALCTPGMGVNLWGESPLYVNPVNVSTLTPGVWTFTVLRIRIR